MFLGHKINTVLWKNGSGGFGLGIWRVNYQEVIVWTIAIGPITIYAAKPKINDSVVEEVQ